MATFTKSILSGSTDGRGIEIAATATAGTLLHTGSTTATDLDEIWLWAVNSSATAEKLTLEWGGVTVSDDLIELTIPAEGGLIQITPGLLIKGNAVALIVRAFAGTTNVINIHGFVNRVS